MVTQVRIGSVENRYALTRLAAKAQQDGIKLFRDRTGRYFASSASCPGTLHYVTGYSCDCKGFITHGRCKHHAALMTALGWVDGTPEPTQPVSRVKNFDTTSVCSTCNGTGSECGTVASGRSWRYDSIVCTSCHGTGTITAAA